MKLLHCNQQNAFHHVYKAVHTFFHQDPTAEGEAKIRASFDELAEEMQNGFRDLED